MIQQQRAKCATRCLQLPIWSVAHTAIRHYPKIFKAFCMCCFIHLPNSLFKEHLTEVWQEAEWFQVSCSQEVENYIFEASKEKQYIYTSHFQHSQILINISFSKMFFGISFFLKKASLYIFIASVCFLPLPNKFRQGTYLREKGGFGWIYCVWLRNHSSLKTAAASTIQILKIPKFHGTQRTITLVCWPLWCHAIH